MKKDLRPLFAGIADQFAPDISNASKAIADRLKFDSIGSAKSLEASDMPIPFEVPDDLLEKKKIEDLGISEKAIPKVKGLPFDLEDVKEKMDLSDPLSDLEDGFSDKAKDLMDVETEKWKSKFDEGFKI